MDLDEDYGIALYELCVYRQFPTMLCFGPITREFLRQDLDLNYVVNPEDVDHDNMFTMIFKARDSVYYYSSANINGT